MYLIAGVTIEYQADREAYLGAKDSNCMRSIMRTFVRKKESIPEAKSRIAGRADRSFSSNSCQTGSILHVQRSIGNLAVQRLLRSDTAMLAHGANGLGRQPSQLKGSAAIQAKLAIGILRGKYDEHWVVSQVMRMPDSPQLQRAYCTGFSNSEKGEDEPRVRRKTQSRRESMTNHESAVSVMQGGDRPLTLVDRNPRGISTISAVPMVNRYSHQDCTEADLRAHIWPATHIARRMVNRAVAALSRPLTPHVRNLMMLNFNDASAATVAAVLAKFRAMKAEFEGDDYQYECEDVCDTANAYVYGFWTDIHLCMNRLRGRSNNFIAGVIVHEMSHYAAGTDDNEYFYPGRARTTLKASDAIDNGDSYEGFVGRL